MDSISDDRKRESVTHPNAAADSRGQRSHIVYIAISPPTAALHSRPPIVHAMKKKNGNCMVNLQELYGESPRTAPFSNT